MCRCLLEGHVRSEWQTTLHVAPPEQISPYHGFYCPGCSDVGRSSARIDPWHPRWCGRPDLAGDGAPKIPLSSDVCFHLWMGGSLFSRCTWVMGYPWDCLVIL
ncbi:hypothetical protein GOP47_0001059 [Adiantum capillus-veneris]|uniref:Uncharacterized protein n=1 Tax=Adiantum capillus-veneris TaxID=13818 RepID=A0A9D4VDI1_ADICA|nr:hypothetical protein GOP47_0000204 [Adiantum capillus-veneris]KAI5084890.1 hypothetical protein GOP47_0001059 [Adiantum capillus-veneris]